MFEDIFLQRKPVTDKLLQYGFQKINDEYSFTTEIICDAFELTVTFGNQGQLNTSLMEKETGYEYILHKTSAQGAFVGNVRMEISKVLEDISNQCFEPSIYKQEQTLHLIDYVSREYGDELEFIWPKFPTYSVFRRKDTHKWYCTILTIAKSKLGFDSDETVEVADLHAPTETINDLLKQQGFHPGWHMNKKHWFTVILDGSISNKKLHQLIQQSYNLAVK